MLKLSLVSKKFKIIRKRYIEHPSIVVPEVHHELSSEKVLTTTFYEDADGDGYGLETSPTEACQKPEGYAQYDGDCIDDDPGINPDATEVCDGIDNDCDGAADEGTKIAIYLDADGDGYGQDPPAGASCADSIPEGWSSEGMDCNDDDDAIHPGAEEICDGVDNDCNSETDELPSCD